MVGQDIQKHNPDSIEEGYDTRAPTPTSRTYLEDDVLDTTLSSELHITEEDSEGSYHTEHNENIDESEGEDTLNVSYKTCLEYEDMDEDVLSVLYETCQSEQDINEHMNEFEDGGTPNRNVLNKTFIVDEDELEDLEVMGPFQPDIAIYKQVDECVRKNTLSTLLNTRRQASTSHLYSDETVAEGMIKESLELIALGKDKKIMFGIPCYAFSENTSLIDFLVRNLHILKTQELSTYERYQLDLLSSKISDLVSTGIYMSKEALKLLPPDLLEKRNNYLSNLKQIVSDSIEKDVTKDIIVERDNGLYYIQCPEESVVTPAKFINNPEFQNLDGALKIGEGDDVIRIQDGKYHDIKGRFQMTFPISNSEKIVMTLSSEKADKPENASSFGKIMVHMDDKSCEIFSKYLKELEKEPRISKVVEAAKSFLQNKPPLSSMGDANVQQLQSNVESLQSSGQSPG